MKAGHFVFRTVFSKEIVINSQFTKAHLTCNMTEVFTSFLTTVSWSKMNFKFQPRIPKADISLSDFGWGGGKKEPVSRNDMTGQGWGVTTCENKGAITM